MPPRGTTSNRIGLGIGYDDPGDSTLRYLREVNTAARDLMRTFREMGTMRIEIPGAAGGRSPELVTQASAEAQKRRISDVTQHVMAEGRRMADTMTQLAAKTDADLKKMALTFQSLGHTEMVSEIEKILQSRATSLPTATPEQIRRILNPDPNRFVYGQNLPEPAPARVPRTRVINAEARELTPEEEAARFREETIRGHITRQQRQGVIRQWQFEQESTRKVGSVLGEKEVGRGEVDLEFERRERRRTLNERINERYEQQQAQQQAQEAQERTHAAMMQRRTQEAEAAATRAGYRTPSEQSALEQERMRAYQAQYIPLRSARTQRVNQQEGEQQRARFVADQERLAREDQVRREARRAADEERARQTEIEQRRHDQEAARNRVETRGTRAAYETQARYERQAAGPETPERVRVSNVEAQKKATTEIRAEVRRTQQTFDEFRTEAGKDLDQITQKSSTMASQFIANSRRYSGQLRTDARATAGSFNTILERAEALRTELARPANMRRSAEEIRAELAQVRADMETTIRESQRLKVSMAEEGQDNPRANSPFQRGLFGVGAYGGFGTAIARMIEYGAIYKGIQAFKDLTKASIESAEAQAQAQTELASATRQAGLLANENERIVQAIQGQAGASRTVALGITAASTRFATQAGMPGSEGDIARIMANIGASRGLGNAKLPELIEQATHERGRFAQEYLGVPEETILRQYAMRHRTEIEGSFQDTQKRTRTIQQDVAGLSDLEKQRALLEALQQRQGQFMGALADRMDTVAGRAERVKASWDNMTASMGQFILSSQSITTILDWLAEKMGGIKGPDELPGGGPGGLLTPADIQARAQAGVGTGGYSAAASVPFREVMQLGGIGSLVYHLFGGGQGVSAGDIPLIGPIINAKRAQNEGQELELNQAQDRLSRQNMARFLQLQQAGRVVYKDAQGKEYTQEQMNQMPQAERGRVLQNFNFGAGQGYRVEGDTQFNERMKKAFDERIKIYREMNEAEQAFNDQLSHRVNALGKLRQVQLGLPQTQEQYGQGIGAGNPFVAPMTQMETAAERVKLQWGGFSQNIQDTFVQVERGNALFEIQKARLDQIVEASHELLEAKRLELSANLELTGTEERRLKVNELQAQAAVRIPQLLLQARQLERGYVTPNEARGAFAQTLQNVFGLAGATPPASVIPGLIAGVPVPTAGRQIAGGIGLMGEGRPLQAWEQSYLRSRFIFPGGQPYSLSGQLGRRQQAIADQALRQFAGGIPPGMLYSDDPQMRELRNALADANRREAERMGLDIQDEMRRAQVGDLAAQGASNLVRRFPAMQARALSEGRERGLTGAALTNYTQRVTDEYRRRLIAETGALGEKELTPELRQARIEALTEDAAARLRMEQQAQTTRQQTLVFIAQILAEIQSYRKAIGQAGAEGYNVAVTVENDTLARIDEKALKQLQTGFAAKQAKRQDRLDNVNPFANVMGSNLPENTRYK